LLQQQEILLIAQINQLVGSQENKEFVASKDSASKELARGTLKNIK